MQLLFLGTGAADWPRDLTENKGEYRRWSSALVDDILLIDPGPHAFEAMKTFGKDPAKVKYIINTHPHADHFCPETVAQFEALGAVFTPLDADTSATLGNYTVSAYQANHGTCSTSVHFLITDGDRTLFYALDSAWLLYAEVQAIIGAKPDLLVLDATIGDVDGDYRIFEHNNLNMVLEMQKTLAPHVKRFCISHMARTLHTDHETLVKRMAPHGVLVACDGLTIDV